MKRKVPIANRVRVLVHVLNPLWEQNTGLQDKIIEIINSAFTHPCLHPYLEQDAHRIIEMAVVLADNNTIQGLNATYRDQNKPTNVLSFPQEELDPDNHSLPEPFDEVSMLGDMLLAYETIEREAKEQSKSLDNHVCHLVIHGLLHLLGYDHVLDREAELMEGLEVEILSQKNIPNPYE